MGGGGAFLDNTKIMAEFVEIGTKNWDKILLKIKVQRFGQKKNLTKIISPFSQSKWFLKFMSESEGFILCMVSAWFEQLY